MPAKQKASKKATSEPKAAEPSSSRVKQETVGVVLGEHHKAAVETLQLLSGLSRSDVIRQLLDLALGRSWNHNLLDVVLNRAEQQQKLLAALRVGDPDWPAADVYFVRQVVAFAHAGPYVLDGDRLGFEGYVVYNVDVRENGVKRLQKVTQIIVAELRPGKELNIVDWGPGVEDNEIGRVNFIEY